MRPYRAVYLLILIALFLGLSPVAAQQWQGSAVLAVRVTNNDGDAVADAQVLARMSEGDPNTGPASVMTGAGGEAVISGLAEGEWFVEISHAGYMLYAAYVDLKAGKKPQVGFSSQVNTEQSFTPMKVRFVKASPSFNRSSGQTRRSEKSEPAEVVRPAPAPTPSRSQPPTVVRPEPRAAEPEPPAEAPEPEPEAPTPGDPTPEDPASESPASEAPEASVEAPEVAPEPVEPPPSPETTSDPAPLPEPAQSPPEDDPVTQVPEERPAPPADPTPAVDPPAEEVSIASPTVEIPAEDVSAAEIPAVETPAVETPAEEIPAAEPTVESSPISEPTPSAEPALEEVEVPTPTQTQQVPEPEPLPAEPAPEPAVEAMPSASEAPPTTPEPPMEEPADDPMAMPEATEEPAAETEEVPTTSSGETSGSERVAAPPAPTAEPTPEAPPAASAGRVPRYLRSAAAGNCAECETGEWAVAAEQVAARSGDGPQYRECTEGFEESARQGAELLADMPADRLDDYAGPILTALFRIAPGDDRREIQDLLAPLTEPESYCQLAGVVLPRSASFSGYVLEAWDSLGGRSCRGDVSCAVGQARWMTEPIVVEGDERIVVYDVFKNRSSRRERRARMTIYFQPPTDWSPGR